MLVAKLSLIFGKIMSRIGFKIIKVPKDVNLNIKDDSITISGPKGELVINLKPDIKCELKGDILKINRLNDKKDTKMNHGTIRSNINNAIIGVVTGFKKELEIRGIGYKASMQNNQLCLNIGFSHQIFIKPTINSKIICKDATNIVVEGIDKCSVGQTAALIRNVRPPEPYNGKGIRYFGEVVLQKEGKRVVTSTASSGGSTKK